MKIISIFEIKMSFKGKVVDAASKVYVNTVMAKKEADRRDEFKESRKCHPDNCDSRNNSVTDNRFDSYLARYQYGKYDGKDKYCGVSNDGNKPGCTLKQRAAYAASEGKKLPRDCSWNDPKRSEQPWNGFSAIRFLKI